MHRLHIAKIMDFIPRELAHTHFKGYFYLSRDYPVVMRKFFASKFAPPSFCHYPSFIGALNFFYVSDKYLTLHIANIGNSS